MAPSVGAAGTVVPGAVGAVGAPGVVVEGVAPGVVPAPASAPTKVQELKAVTAFVVVTTLVLVSRSEATPTRADVALVALAHWIVLTLTPVRLSAYVPRILVS